MFRAQRLGYRYTVTPHEFTTPNFSGNFERRKNYQGVCEHGQTNRQLKASQTNESHEIRRRCWVAKANVLSVPCLLRNKAQVRKFPSTFEACLKCRVVYDRSSRWTRTRTRPGTPGKSDRACATGLLHQENVYFAFSCFSCFFYLPQVKKAPKAESTEYFPQEIPFTLFNPFSYFI